MSADGKTIVVGDVLGSVHFLELVGADESISKDVKIEEQLAGTEKELEQRS